MRNPLNKRLPREFKKNAGKYIGLFVLLVTTIMLGASFSASIDSTVKLLEVNDRECRIEDGQFETAESLSEELLSELNEKDITVTENFYSSVHGFDTTAKLLVFNERNTLNLPSLFTGKLPATENEIAVERLFAKNRGIKVGDTIDTNGIPMKVTGIIAVPDYNSLYKSNQDLLPNTTDFGISLVTKEGFEQYNKDSLTYRYSYAFKDTRLTKQEENEKVADILKTLAQEGVNLQSFLTAEQNQSITFLREDIGKDGPVMKVFIYILIIVIAFVFVILTNNTIEAEAAIIGTLRASGYKKHEIIMHYLSPTLILAILSTIVGNILGYTVMLEPFKELYYTTYSIPPLEIRFSLEAFIVANILPVAIMIAINWFMLYNKLSLSPLKFLRKDLHKKKQKRALKLPDFSFMTRFRIRVLLQNKVNYLILFVGVFIASFLLMFGMGLQPLIDHYVDEIDDSLEYEYQYLLKAPIEIENAEKLETYSLKTWYSLGKTDISISFMGVSEDSIYFDKITLPEKENTITISKPLAEKMNLKVNDTVSFKDEYYDVTYTLTVTDICDYKGSLTAFMKRESLNSLLGNEVGYYNAYLSDTQLDIPDSHLMKYITRADMVDVTAQLMKSFDGVLELVNIFSIVIYMVLIYILTKTVVEKNALSISFMKVFGYNSKEIGKLYLNATTITVIISLLVCIPIEALCFKVILVYIASMIEGYIPFYLPAWVYITIITIGIVAYFAINALHLRKVKRIPMSEALKNRE